VNICGTIVSSKKSRKEAVYLNFDRKYPNSPFYATIWKNNQNNFSYDPEKELIGKTICVKGEVTVYDGKPRMSINKEQQITFWDDVQGEIEIRMKKTEKVGVIPYLIPFARSVRPACRCRERQGDAGLHERALPLLRHQGHATETTACPILEGNGMPTPFDPEVLRSLWSAPQREFHHSAVDIMEKQIRSIKESDLSLIEEFIVTNSWWDTVDGLSSWIVRALLPQIPRAQGRDNRPMGRSR
jgi:hypothetical protein